MIQSWNVQRNIAHCLNIPAKWRKRLEIVRFSTHRGRNRFLLLLENPKFAELTRQIALYQEGVLASGVAAQNQMYNSMSSLMLEHGRHHGDALGGAEPDHCSR